MSEFFDHPLLKRAAQFVSLKETVGYPPDIIYIIYEYSVWLTKQQDIQEAFEKVSKRPDTQRKIVFGVDLSD